MAFSADLKLVSVQVEAFQVVLHLGYGPVVVNVWKQKAADLCCGSGLEGTVHHQTERLNLSIQAGDVCLDLTEEISVRALQFIIQVFKVMAEAGKSLYWRSGDLNWWSH